MTPHADPTKIRRGPGPPRSPARFASNVRPPEGDYLWVYLWGWPLRVMHWTAAFAVVALVVTGIYIGRPFVTTSGEAVDHFLMGRMRFVHFLAAAFLVATGIVRLYWLFMGNRFERWPALIPLRGREWKALWLQLKYYALLEPVRPRYLGHNPLQQIMYTGVYVIVVIMAITGFAMYGQSNPTGLIAGAFGWVAPMLGGMQVVRLLHHALMWLLVLFIPIHIYTSLRADWGERSGVISSMISGGAFVDSDHEFLDE